MSTRASRQRPSGARDPGELIACALDAPPEYLLPVMRHILDQFARSLGPAARIPDPDAVPKAMTLGVVLSRFADTGRLGELRPHVLEAVVALGRCAEANLTAARAQTLGELVPERLEVCVRDRDGVPCLGTVFRRIGKPYCFKCGSEARGVSYVRADLNGARGKHRQRPSSSAR